MKAATQIEFQECVLSYLAAIAFTTRSKRPKGSRGQRGRMWIVGLLGWWVDFVRCLQDVSLICSLASLSDWFSLIDCGKECVLDRVLGKHLQLVLERV